MGLINFGQMNWRNFWLCYFISLGQIAFGYPASIIGTTLGEPSFLAYMKVIDPKSGLATAEGNSIIGAFSGVFQAGAFLNAFVVSYVMDRWGRKAAFRYCAVLSLVGGAILCGSVNSAMFIVARFIAGAGSWGFLCITPVYSSELAPPQLRGLFVGMNGMNISFGYALASYVGMAFYYTKDPVANWRAPLGLALLWPIMMLVICQIAPESPRWLMSKGRIDEAKEVVMRIHRVKGDPDQEFARGEFFQMQQQAELEKKFGEVTWLDMFRKPSHRKRTLTAMLYAFLGQSTGILVMTNYGPSLYKALGYGTEDQLRLQCGWVTIGVLFNVVGAMLMDHFGRRPLMIFAIGGSCFFLIIEAIMVALYATEGSNKAGLGMGVAAFYLFLAVYSPGVDCAAYVYYSEIFPNHMRHKGVALCIAAIALTDLVYLQAASTAFANIGWKFYLVFIIITFLGTIALLVFLPETKGIPLEEIAKIFGDDDEVAVYAEYIHVDHNTHELIIDEGKPSDHLSMATLDKPNPTHRENVV